MPLLNSIKIGRAHSYDAVYSVRWQLGDTLPPAWSTLIEHWPWHIYPEDLSPSWTGLLLVDSPTLTDGRPYSRMAGWTASEEYSGGCHPASIPHIFVRAEHAFWAATHEAAHALAFTLSLDRSGQLAALYRPERALNAYMAVNNHEYFAEGVEAFCNPPRWHHAPNRDDLARADPDLYAYLLSLETR